jgi:ribose transport system substrate-binding protein
MRLKLGLVLAVSATALSAACSSSATVRSGRSAASGTNVSASVRALDALYHGTWSAPPTSGPAAKAGRNIWIIPCAQFVAACATPARGAANAATAVGWKTTMYDPQYVAQKFSDGIRSAVSAGADAIVLIGIDCNQAKGALQQAKTSGIRVVAGNAIDCDDPAVGGAALYSAASNYTALSVRWGEAKAQYLAAKVPGGAKVIEFNLDYSLPLKYERRGFDDALAECASCSVVGHVELAPSDIGNPTILRQKTASVLQQHPEANSIYYLYDSLATSGPAAAVASSGRTLAAIGGEGYAANMALIRSNRGQTAAMGFPSDWVGWACIDTLNRVFAGMPAVDEGLGFQAVDSTHNLPAPGKDWGPSIDYRSAYLKLWGVSG